MEALFLKLLDMGVSASWLILTVIAARFLLRNAPKSARCILWALVALRLACPVTIPSPVSLAPQAPAVGQILTAREVALPRKIPTFRNQGGATPDDAESAKPESASAPLRLTKIFSAVWLAGLSAMLLCALAGFLRLRRTVSASLPTGGNLWICDDIPAPFILGILRPRVYLPSNLDEARTRYVIAHENAHLRHYDHFWKPFGYALLSVYWFHPLVWVAYVLFCRDLELACDERVVREMKLSERAAYSQALLDCSRERGSVAACPLAFGETSVKTRVKAVLNYRKPAFGIAAVSVIVCAVVAACFMTSPPVAQDSALLPEAFATSESAYEGSARLVAEMPVLGGKLKQVELRVRHDFRGYDTVHELLMAPTGKEFGIESGYLLYSGETPPESVVYDRKTEAVTFKADGRQFVYDARSWAKH